MFMKKVLTALFCLVLCSGLFSQEAILLKNFKINGKEETKKVKVIEKVEYTYSGQPKIISENGKVKEINFYDEKDFLVKKWNATWNNKNDLLSFQYDLEGNIAERKVADNYKETLYCYDEHNRLIKTTVTNSDEYSNYFYDDDGRLIQKEDNTGIYKYEYNDKNQIIHEITPVHSEFYYEYDDKGREIYSKEIDDRNNLYEWFTRYDDEKNTREFRKAKKHDGNVVFDFTDYHEYDSNGNLVYSKYYTSIITTETELLSAEIKESFWEYYKDDDVVINKIIFRGKERNLYYETFLWDNGNPNSVTVYEEVE